MCRSDTVLLLDAPGSTSWNPWGAAAWRAIADLPRVMSPPDEALALVHAATVVIDPRALVTPALARAAAGQVRLWQLLSVGYDGVDLRTLHDSGVPVANSPGYTSATALAEHAFALMLLSYSGITLVSDVGASAGEPRRELRGKTLLLIGFGASARRLAVLAAAARMKVRAVSRHPPRRVPPGVEVLAWAQLDSLLPQADIVSLHVPANNDTYRLIDSGRLSLIKDGAAIVNVCRGSLIDEPALIRELRSRRLSGVGLDVVANEPLQADAPIRNVGNAKLTPHVAGNTLETADRRGRFAAANARRVLRGLPPRCLITSETAA
jgi:phosphoglycerate dehydrogenase-like enzyme